MSGETGRNAQTDVLVIAAHPDDAELAVGGFISYLSDIGKSVTIVNFTVSEVDDAARAKRISAATDAAKILNARLEWANGRKLDQVEDLPGYACVKEVDRIVSLYNPKVVITHPDVDSHADHTRLSQAVLASSRRWGADIYMFQPNEYRSPVYQTFQPNFFIDTDKYIGKKCAAIDCYNYNSQNFRRLDTDAIRKLDAARGAPCGYGHAEGLKVVRKRGIDFL